jgi:fluoroquinolone transport system permease protein
MYLFFGLYPIILGILGYFITDFMNGKVEAGTLDFIVPKIVAMFLIIMTGYVFGALTAFTLLDDKDDNVLMSLKITPIDVKVYVIVKLVVSFIFGFISTLVLTLATNFLDGASIWAIIGISIVAALQAPGVTLIVNSLSNNKVEGFVYMKLSGLILIIPVLAFFYFDWTETFFIVAPGFWSARMISIELLSEIPTIEFNFTMIVYFIAGVIYNIIFSYVFLKIYAKKSNI